MLVVVEHRNLHPFAELLLDVERLRGLDVLQVDAAERRLERRDALDEAVWVVRVELEVEDVDVGELLEQHAFALHHGLGGERADVAESQHGGAVGDDRDEVATRGVEERLRRIVSDLEAGLCDAGGVGQGEVELAVEGLGGDDLDLSGASGRVVVERVPATDLSDSHRREG